MIPLWGKIVMISLAKKGLILSAGYMYGFPRLYRKSQKLVRFISKDPLTRASIGGYVQTAFRLPAKLLHMQPQTPTSPALQYLQRLPIQLLPSARKESKQLQMKLEAAVRPSRMYARWRTSFASSMMAQRRAEGWAASSAKFSSLRNRFAASSTLQRMVEFRARQTARLWSNLRQPYTLTNIPAISL